MNTSQAGQGQFKVELLSPPNVKPACRCQLQELSSHLYRVSFIPPEPGIYQLRFLFNNQPIQDKPVELIVHPIAPSPRTSNPTLVRIHQIHPTHPPEIGDDICLQSNSIIYFLLLCLRIIRVTLVTPEHPSIHSIQGQILCNGIPINGQLERYPETNSWYLKFPAYRSGTYQVHLTQNGSSLTSK